MTNSALESRQYAAQVRAETRHMTIQAYGGKCVCCGETEERLLLLAYGNIEEVKRTENRHPLDQIPAEYRWLRTHNFPVHTRMLICRKCNLRSDREHFPGKCDIDHEEYKRPGIYDEIDDLAHLRAIKEFAEQGKPRPTAPLEVLLRYSRRDLVDDEQEFVDLYRKYFYNHARSLRNTAEYHRLKAEMVRSMDPNRLDGTGYVEEVKSQYWPDPNNPGQPVNVDLDKDPDANLYHPVTIIGEVEFSDE
jgi:hypothetical protein